MDPKAEVAPVAGVPNAEGCPNADPVVDGAVVVEEPNADGCVPANAEKPPPPPLLEGAPEPNALGPVLAKEANAPPVAGLISDDVGVLV